MEKSITNGIKDAWLPIQASRSARNTINPIRRIVDRMKITPNPSKEMISLSIGDPTHYRNMLPPLEALEAILEAVQLPTSHGYPPSFGILEARKAVAHFWSRTNYTLKADDVILTSGCSHALQMSIECFADPGDNILLPRPGFSLYVTLCQSLGIETRFYNLIPNENWQVDLTHLESLINDRTRAVLINNPSNPCGAVYTEKHLRELIDICERYHLPIIADEIYADMVFPNNTFYFLGVLSKNVPVLSCGGISKRFICPGWRLGWIVIHDRHDLLKDSIKPGLIDLSTRILGPSSVTQAALPHILLETPDSYFDDIIHQLQSNAEYVYQTLSEAPGLEPTMPQGAMYMLIRINISDYLDIENDKDFFTKLLCEESISCLPASVFGIDNFFRIVLTTPMEKTEEACQRILEFCRRHAKTQQDVFDQFIQNETYRAAENQLQQTEKSSLISNKVLLVIIVCLSIIVIATLLTLYFIKDQIKDFTNRMDIGQRGSVIHQFHPEVLLHSSIQDQTSPYRSTVNQQSATNLPLYH